MSAEMPGGPVGHYAANALKYGKHGAPRAPKLVSRAGKLPSAPSEMDWAIHWMLQHRGQEPRDACLDVGCAHLELLRAVEPLFRLRVGVDICGYPVWVQQPAIHTHVCDLDKGSLPFRDDIFDVVTMLMTLEHVFDPFHAVREIRRVVSGAGLVIIGVPNIAGIRHRLGLLVGRFPVTSARFTFEENAWDGYHLHNFTKASLTWLLEREGLEPVRWATHGKGQWLKRISPSVFGADLIVLCRKAHPKPMLAAAF